MVHPAKTMWLASERNRFLISLVLGAILFLATDEPLPSVLLSSVQAGWSSFLAGCWLLRSDSNRRRAWVCFIFQTATAAWQVAAASFVSVLFMVFMSELLGRQLNLDKFAFTMLTLAGGVGFSTMLGLVATGIALWQGVRVWSHPLLELEECENILTTARQSHSALIGKRFNYAIFVVGTSLVTPVVLIGIGLLLFGSVRANPEDVDVLPTVLGFATILLGPLLMIFVYAWVSRRIIARTSTECW